MPTAPDNIYRNALQRETGSFHNKTSGGCFNDVVRIAPSTSVDEWKDAKQIHVEAS